MNIGQTLLIEPVCTLCRHNLTRRRAQPQALLSLLRNLQLSALDAEASFPCPVGHWGLTKVDSVAAC